MATYNYNDKVKLILPDEYSFSKWVDDDGKQQCSILFGEYKNDEGETAYEYDFQLSEFLEENTQDTDKIRAKETLDELIQNGKKLKFLKVPGSPKSLFSSSMLEINLWGNAISIFGITFYFCAGEYSVLSITGADNSIQCDNDELYEKILTVAKSVRVNGKKLPLGEITVQQLQDALKFSNEDDVYNFDYSPSELEFQDGDKTITCQVDGERLKIFEKSRFTRISPDINLYPHYDSMMAAAPPAIPGMTFIVNPGGTEYEFIPLRKISTNYNIPLDMKAVYDRIAALDKTEYTLHKKAKELQKLFHVNKSAFNPRHDRECELESGYMHRAYMMSGLRSFAWTLTDYCTQNNCSPEDVDTTTAVEIANFVADANWLNYDGDTYCQGLCSGSDLHVYFVPDSISRADKNKLAPSNIDNFFGSSIHNSVHSLDALREDLAYIYPAVKVLWDYLKENRNYDEALLGNEADIVYAWCALALAAREPFFSEDGPMTCFFTQLVHDETQPVPREIKKVKPIEKAPSKESAAPRTNPASYATAQHIPQSDLSTSDFNIDLSGKLTGYVGSAEDITLPDGISTIGEDAFLCNEKIKSVVIPEGVKTIEAGAFWMCSNLKRVQLPSSICEIGNDAFNSTALESIEIPEGCRKIGSDCFTACTSLNKISVPRSVSAIGVDAFCTCNSKTVILTKPDSYAQTYVKNTKVSPQRINASPQQPQAEKKEGCYIATAVYGSYSAPEVMTLRRFRDETLKKSLLGRWFIRVYYYFSPPLAEKLKNTKRINAFVRAILDIWVHRLNGKQR